jgi:hypothetical protein
VPEPAAQPNPADPQPQGGAPAGAPAPAGADTPPPAATEHMIPKSRFDEVNNRLQALEREQAKAARDAQKAADDAAAAQGQFKELAEQRAAKLAETEAALKKERTATAILRAATEAQFPVDVAERMVDVEYDASGAITTDIPAAITALAARYPQLVAGAQQNGAPRPGNGGGPRPAGTPTHDELVKQETERLRAHGGYARLG